MTCRSILNTKPLTFLPSVTVRQALEQMREKGVSGVPVVDVSGTVVGFFSKRGLIGEILPVSMTVEEGSLQELSGLTLDALPGFSRRLERVLDQSVAVVMDRKLPTRVFPDTPLHEALRLIVDSGNAVIVTHPDTAKLEGLITEDDILTAFNADQKNASSRLVKKA